MAHLDHWSLGLLAFVPVILAGMTPITGPAFVLAPAVAAFAPQVVRWWTTSPVVARIGHVVAGFAVVAALAVSASEIAAITT